MEHDKTITGISHRSMRAHQSCVKTSVDSRDRSGPNWNCLQHDSSRNNTCYSSPEVKPRHRFLNLVPAPEEIVATVLIAQTAYEITGMNLFYAGLATFFSDAAFETWGYDMQGLTNTS